MLRFRFHGIAYDISYYMRCHKFKFLTGFLIALAGCVFGIWSALARTGIGTEISGIQKFNIILLIAGGRKFFGYFLFRFFVMLALVALISLCGVRPFSAWLSFLIILLFAYQSAYFAVTVFILLKLSALPLMLLCLVPLFFIFLFILVFYSVFILCFSYYARCDRFSDFWFFVCSLRKPFFTAAAVVCIASLLETALACLLTIGIII